MGTSKIFEVNDNSFSPTDLSAFVLKKLKQEAGNQIGDISEAVITVPANYGNKAREATMEAAKKAGLKVKFIINEPTAAALYYAFKEGEELSGFYIVYDLGGGTFDVSVIRAEGQDVKVIASNGVVKLGGYDFDKVIRDLVFKKYREETGEECDPQEYQIDDAEEEKKSLSNRQKVMVRIGREGIEISREDFEEGISSLVAQTEMLCENTLEEAGISAGDIKGVFLAGGSTRIPIVKESVRRVFQQEPIASANVDEVVALGAALYAAFKSDKSHLSATQQDAIKKIKMKEVTGKCYGIIALAYNEELEKQEEQNIVLIEKGTQIPCSVTKPFFTVSDDQRLIKSTVTESESSESDPRFANVISGGELKVPPGRPKGQKIEVTFSYDANQMMHVKFLDVESGKEVNISLSMTSSEGKETEDIDKFIVE